MTVAELQRTGVRKQNSQEYPHRTSTVVLLCETKYTSKITVGELQRPESG